MTSKTKQIKLEMMRYCLTWGFREEMAQAYFKQRGYKLSHTHFYDLKNEVQSDKETEQWFNNVALNFMEKDHKDDYLAMQALQSVLMAEVNQLNMTNVYTQEGKGDNVRLILNEDHDTNNLTRTISAIESLMKTKADMLAATPIVQAIMVKKRKDESDREELEAKALATQES